MNEQPQSHWIHTFASREFEAFDIFRPAIWNNENVCWWYRDNFLLFVHRDSAVPDRDAFRTMQQPIFDIVHPANYAQKLRVCRERITNLEMQLTAATPKQPFEP